MTLEEKRDYLRNHCNTIDYCKDCPIDNIPNAYCKVSTVEDADQSLINAALQALGMLSDSVDNVNHPSHYETGNFECIDVMMETQGTEEVFHFCVCNAFKYLYRHSRKNGMEDIKKAIWYLTKAVELKESKEK